MKIVHVIRQYKPGVGGLEDAVHNLCLQLNRMEGTSARVVTLDKIFSKPYAPLPAHEMIDGVEVTRIPYKGSTRYPLAFGVLRAIADADIVHVHAIDFFFDYLSITRFVHFKPLVASTHGGFFHTSFAARLKKLFFNTITRMSCVGYKTICASSENDAATFSRIASNVVTIENGVDIEKWNDQGSRQATKTLIFIGRWSANKRVPVLIQLIEELRRSGEDWQLIIAGIPADETTQSLTQAAVKHKVADAVRIVTAPSGEEIKQLIQSANYITSASSYEGFGISIIEGLSAGLVPVITPLPPFKKLLNALGFGVTLQPDDLSKTALALREQHTRLMAETDGLRNKAIALSAQYAWQGVAQKFYDVYKAALRR